MVFCILTLLVNLFIKYRFNFINLHVLFSLLFKNFIDFLITNNVRYYLVEGFNKK